MNQDNDDDIMFHKTKWNYTSIDVTITIYTSQHSLSPVTQVIRYPS